MKYSEEEARLLCQQAEIFMTQVNESIQLAHNSTVPSTKVSRLEFAKARLTELQNFGARHPILTITNLDGMLRTMQRMEKEFSEAGYYAETDAGSRDFSLHIARSIDGDSLVSGFRFSATFQLRTPSRYLRRHGEIAHGQPITCDEQHGSWIPILKTFKELGMECPEIVLDGRTKSSDIGPIPLDGGSYLPFLLAVRAIVEDAGSIEGRIARLREELRRPAWADFCKRLGGQDAIYTRFFPRFLDSIPRLPTASVEALWSSELMTAAALARVPDIQLLAIKGIGPAKLESIRAACRAAADQHSERLDLVER